MGWLQVQFAPPSLVLGIIAILGGIYALRRRIWGLALAGSICALSPLGLFLGYSPLYSSAWGRANLSKVQGSASYEVIAPSAELVLSLLKGAA